MWDRHGKLPTTRARVGPAWEEEEDGGRETQYSFDRDITLPRTRARSAERSIVLKSHRSRLHTDDIHLIVQPYPPRRER